MVSCEPDHFDTSSACDTSSNSDESKCSTGKGKSKINPYKYEILEMAYFLEPIISKKKVIRTSVKKRFTGGM